MPSSAKGGGPAQREQPRLQRNSVQPTYKKEGLVSEPWARNAAPSAHRPGRGAAFLQTGVLFFPLLLLSIVVVLLWGCWPLGPKWAFMENTLPTASLISLTAAKIAFLNVLSLRLTKNNNNIKRYRWKENGCFFYLFACFLLLTFSKQGLDVLNTTDPNFIRLFFKSPSLRIRLYLFCCLNAFWCLIRSEQTVTCCFCQPRT